MFRTVQWKSRVVQLGDERVVVLPRELVLEGTAIVIRQDKWGDIAIYPTSPEGIRALEKFGPFEDCDGDEIG